METVSSTLLEQTAKPERKLFMDVARILAVFAVVMIHVSASFANAYTYSTDFVAFLIGDVFTGLSSLGVPLFLMISGALLLDESKDVSWGYIFKKIKTIAFLLIFWSACYSLFFSVIWPAYTGTAIDIKDVIRNFILGHYHLWYLYMLIGLYLITPFLRSFVKKGNEKTVLAFIGISIGAQFFIEFLSVLSVYVGELSIIGRFIDKFELHFFGGFTTYYLLGWYVVHIGIEKKKRIILYCSAILSLIAIVILTVLIKPKGGVANPDKGLLRLLYSVGVFVLLSGIKNERLPKGKLRDVILLLSNLTFGVYVVHIFVLWFIEITLSVIVNSLFTMIVRWILTTGLSFAICYVISKIPYVKKLIRG